MVCYYPFVGLHDLTCLTTPYWCAKLALHVGTSKQKVIKQATLKEVQLTEHDRQHNGQEGSGKPARHQLGPVMSQQHGTKLLPSWPCRAVKKTGSSGQKPPPDWKTRLSEALSSTPFCSLYSCQRLKTHYIHL